MSTYGMSYEYATGEPLHQTPPAPGKEPEATEFTFQTETATPESLVETLNRLASQGCRIHTIYVSRTYGSSGSRSAAELTIVYLQGLDKPNG